MDGKKVEDDQKMAKRTKWVPLNKHFTSQNRHFPTFNFILFCVKRKSLEDISVWNYAKLVKKKTSVFYLLLKRCSGEIPISKKKSLKHRSNTYSQIMRKMCFQRWICLCILWIPLLMFLNILVGFSISLLFLTGNNKKMFYKHRFFQHCSASL